MSNDPLFSPLQMRQHVVKNRIASTAHSMRYTLNGMPTDRYVRYNAEKARGGVGLIVVGGSAVVSPDSTPAIGNVVMYRDEVVEPLSRVGEAIHEHAGKALIQLTHMGRRTVDHIGSWLPTVSSAPMREPSHRSFPKQAESWDLDRIVEDFGSAAARACAAGLDGVQLGHFGHLLDAFVSPWHLDQLPAEERALMRGFPLRVIRAVRQSLGEQALLGVRMAVDELRPDGLHLDEAMEVLSGYVEAGVDFVDVVVGTIESSARMNGVIPGTGAKSAPFLETVRAVKQRAGVPVLHATKIHDVVTARRAVEDGIMDLVGMTRPNIADPHLVSKVRAGREQEIRPCVAANQCLEGGSTGGVICVHNPATGREATHLHEVETVRSRSRRVAVVGAGPAGLEAAHTAAQLGHDVTVFEQNPEPGGQVRLISHNDRRQDFQKIIDWRFRQGEAHGVNFRFGRRPAAEELRECYDAVIVATGGRPPTATGLGIPGDELVSSLWSVFDDPSRHHGEVVLFDDEGRYASLDALELLAKAGNRIAYVTPERAVGVEVGNMNFAAYQRVFDRHEVTSHLSRRLGAVEDAPAGRMTAVLCTDAGAAAQRLVCDCLVYAGGTVPEADVYLALRESSRNKGAVDYPAFITGGTQAKTACGPGEFDLFRIGDAVSSRNLHAAVLDGHRIALGL